MKISIDNIDIKYINLDKRVDRKKHTEKELAKFNLKAERFSAIETDERSHGKFNFSAKYNKGAVGCFLSHYNIIKNHQSDKIIGIMEDDLLFCADFLDRMDYIEKNFDKEWDIFYLSAYFHNKRHNNKWWNNGHDVDWELTDTKYIVKSYGSSSGQFYLINPKSKEKIISMIEKFQASCHGIDHVYVMMQPDLNCYSFCPGMVTQIVGESNILSRFMDHNTFFFTEFGPHIFANKLKDFDFDAYFAKWTKINGETKK